MALSALAGPMANALLGAISAVASGFFTAWYSYLAYTIDNQFLLNCVNVTGTLFYLSAIYNFLFMAFNLIPVPPFDGSRIALVFLPTRIYFKVMQYERQIMFGVLIAIMVLNRLGYSPFSWIAFSLFDLIYTPVTEGFWSIFLDMLISSFQ
jgi:Zn-dependent protease